MQIKALDAPVKVILDANAVPHIFADSPRDAYLALGYVHARDRLWQMEMQRRVGQGRVAEILGARALEVDRFMRTMGIYQTAEQSFAVLSAETRQALQAYAAGVNFYLDNRKEPLPIEFQLTQHSPQHWKPADSMVWLKMMAFILSGNYKSELLRARLLDILTPQQLQDLFPEPRADDPITLNDSHWSAARNETDSDVQPYGVKGGDRQPVVIADRDSGSSSLWPLNNSPLTQVKASNAWAVSGNHTATGAPILANDPHLMLGAPVLWYLARIVTPELSLSGATAPGLPFHMLAHNGSIAWGLTTTGSDIQDLYYETVSTDPPGRYLTPEGWQALDRRVEKIRVRFGAEVQHIVRATRRGPLLSDINETAADLAGDGRAVSLAFTALQAGDRTIEALYLLNRARNWSELLEAARLIKGPQQNLMYADVQGNIGFIAPAEIPIRNGGESSVPVDAANKSEVWSAYIDFAALPQILNPAKGWLVNANNAVVGKEYPYYLTRNWEAPYRARRIEALIQAFLKDHLAYTVKDAEAMLMDDVSLAALELIPLMTEIEGDSAMARQALALLRDWDGAMRRERVEPLLFMTWLRKLNHALLVDELGPLADDFRGFHPRVVAAILGENRSWCDDVTTGSITEDCKDVLSRSLQKALTTLSAAYGNDMAQWRWGRAHRASFPHPLLSRIPLLKGFFDTSIETNGGNYTVNRGASYGGPIDDETRDNPFEHRHGPGFRAVYDLANLENSRFMIATGQSGNPLSAYYDNFIERWRDGEFITLRGGREELAGSSLGVLFMQP